MITVYKATPDPRGNWRFGLGAPCETWRQARSIREQIAKDAMSSKDNSTPICYDENGNFLVEGWQKGFS